MGHGIVLRGDGNLVEDNYVGVDAAGVQGLGNSRSGIWLGDGARSNRIAGNVISGNAENGIAIHSSFFGPMHEWQTADGGNGHLYVTLRGISWFDAETLAVELSGHLASITSPAEQDFIHSHILDGDDAASTFWIGLTDEASEGTFIWTSGEPVSYTGWDAGEPNNSGNEDWVHINYFATPRGRIGTWNDSARGADNAILEFDAGAAERLADAITGNNTIAGNFIGTDFSGAVAVPNSINGVSIQGGSDNAIGGSIPEMRNVISGNSGDGVRITDSRNNRVQGNAIGTDVNGRAGLGNGRQGVRVFGDDNVVGGAFAGSGNLVSGNGGDGICLEATASHNTVQGNLVGSDLTGTLPISNFFSGIVVRGYDNTVGGDTPEARNVVSGNGTNGVYIWGENAHDNVVTGNYVGTDMTGTAALGNGQRNDPTRAATARATGRHRRRVHRIRHGSE